MKVMIHSVPAALLLALWLPAGAQTQGVAGLGLPLKADRLVALRGGFEVVRNDMQLAGSVTGNTAADVSSGSNFIGGGAFAHASGLPTVIQNTGSNVLIQNATVINVQFQ